jgi:hypothetical protein
MELGAGEGRQQPVPATFSDIASGIASYVKASPIFVLHNFRLSYPIFGRSFPCRLARAEVAGSRRLNRQPGPLANRRAASGATGDGKPIMIDKFVEEASGDASLSTKELRRTVPFTESAMPQVVSKLQDRDAPIPEIMRLVLGEIAAMALEISASPLDAEGNRYRSLCRARIRSLQALQKSLREQAKGNKDELDFDGRKMKFVIAAWVRWVKQALKEGLGKGTDVQQQTAFWQWASRPQIGGLFFLPKTLAAKQRNC